MKRSAPLRMIALTAAALAGTLVPHVATAAVATRPPKLIVAISVDQFSAELFERYRAGFTGGLKRLSGGITFANGYQSHAATETCPGHSTILTGRHPAATGIVANVWTDRQTGAPIYCVSVPGADETARGPQNLRVETLGDWLKAQQPAARVVSVSGKDRAAIMLGGHRADAIYWWQDGRGFVTSPPVGPEDPVAAKLAERFNDAFLTRWPRTRQALWPAASAACRALAAPHLFGDMQVSGAVPPDAAIAIARDQSAPAATDSGDQVRVSPELDQVTLDFAQTLIAAKRLGRGPATDLLAVSFSSTDYVGHRYGNGGAEMCVQMAALDRLLGTLLAGLDGLRVPYAVVLTADHGGSDAAERAAEYGVPVTRVDGGAVIDRLRTHLTATLGLDYDVLAKNADLQDFAIVLKPADAHLRATATAAAVAWLRTQPQVREVLTRAEVAAAVPPPGKPVETLSFAERFHESYDPERSGDVFAVLQSRVSTYWPRKPTDAVAGHGSPWDYDRRVPILFWWPGIAPSAPAQAIETVDIAPTLAALAGVAAPKVDGKCLIEVTRCP